MKVPVSLQEYLQQMVSVELPLDDHPSVVAGHKMLGDIAMLVGLWEEQHGKRHTRAGALIIAGLVAAALCQADGGPTIETQLKDGKRMVIHYLMALGIAPKEDGNGNAS